MTSSRCPHHEIIVDDLDDLPPTSGVFVDGWMAGTIQTTFLDDNSTPMFVAADGLVEGHEAWSAHRKELLWSLDLV